MKTASAQSVLTLLSAILLGLSCPVATGASLTYLGSHTLPTGTMVGGFEVGRLCGITYKAYTDRFLAITDDSRSAGASRMWTVSFSYNGTAFTAANVKSGTPPKTAAGDSLPQTDTEGVVGNLDGSFFVSHEGLAAGSDPVSSIPPWTWKFDDTTGKRLAPGNPAASAEEVYQAELRYFRKTYRNKTCLRQWPARRQIVSCSGNI